MNSSSIKSQYGVHDPMTQGLAQRKEAHEGQFGHPLEASEKNYEKTRFANEMEQLRKMQGIHAPIRIQMERRAVQKVGHLPCITQRSNLLDDVLTGRDEMMTPRDIFGKPEHFEGLSTPHNIIEKHLSKF